MVFSRYIKELINIRQENLLLKGHFGSKEGILASDYTIITNTSARMNKPLLLHHCYDFGKMYNFHGLLGPMRIIFWNYRH